jgi:hypothetical protein
MSWGAALVWLRLVHVRVHAFVHASFLGFFHTVQLYPQHSFSFHIIDMGNGNTPELSWLNRTFSSYQIRGLLGW